MNFLWTYLFAFLIVVCATEAMEEVKANHRVECSAFEALKIRQSGSRRCTGIAKADCTTVASAQDDFKEAYNQWWSEGAACEQQKIEEAAYALATAAAEVYAESISKVECLGAGGFACGWSIAEGTSFAVAMAKAIGQAGVDASSVSSDAFCVADVEAIGDAIAEAAASAQSRACVRGTGSEEDFKAGFVESVAVATTVALVKATASTCDAESAAATQSECYSEAGRHMEGTEKVKAEGSTGSIEECPPVMAECCNERNKSRICRCASCGFWLRTRDYSYEFPRTWEKGGSKESCQCKFLHA